MKNMFKITNNLLTEKVKENLMKIRNNQKEIQDLLKQEKSSVTGTDAIEKKYTINKLLLSENFDFLNVQLTVCDLLKDEKASLSDNCQYTAFNLKEINDCFELTIDGFLIYNSDHPYYSDVKFFDSLLNYHQKLENYEKCMELLRTKKQP